jgi:hypothetical protein
MTQVPQGVKISSYIFYAFAVFAVLGLCASAVSNGLTLANASGNDEVMTSAGISLGVGACISIIFAALYGFVGYSLARLQSWARIAAIILSVLALCAFPIGTIMGGIVLYFLFQPESQAAFAAARPS